MKKIHHFVFPDPLRAFGRQLVPMMSTLVLAPLASVLILATLNSCHSEEFKGIRCCGIDDSRHQGEASELAANPLFPDFSSYDYYGSIIPQNLETPSKGSYITFTANETFNGGLGSLSHQPTDDHGAGQFQFSRVWRTSKYGLNDNEQYGVYPHPWLAAPDGRNSLEGGLWVAPRAAGPHYYPTLHLAGVADKYHLCNDVGGGTGIYNVYLADRWLSMLFISNQILWVPNINIAFDADQDNYNRRNGIWVGWGWTYLELNHPKNFKYWMSFIESFDYQGPVNGYIPEYFNTVMSPAKSQKVRASDNIKTLATAGSGENASYGGESYLKALRINLAGNDIYYVPMLSVPYTRGKTTEYILSNVQNLSQASMSHYSELLRSGHLNDPLIPANFLPFTGHKVSTHEHYKVIRDRQNGQIDDQTGTSYQEMIIMEPPYQVKIDQDVPYNTYLEWKADVPEQLKRTNGNYYYKKLATPWPVESNTYHHLASNPYVYKSQLINPPDAIERVPNIRKKRFDSYREVNAQNLEFKNWDTTGKQRYQAVLQNRSTVTYVWFKFIEQPAMLTAQQNWPEIYTPAYLQELQAYIENIHKMINRNSKAHQTSKATFINYNNQANPLWLGADRPQLAKVDPNQLVSPPVGQEIGYVPVVLSVVHQEEFSITPNIGLEQEPNPSCTNQNWLKNTSAYP